MLQKQAVSAVTSQLSPSEALTKVFLSRKDLSTHTSKTYPSSPSTLLISQNPCSLLYNWCISCSQSLHHPLAPNSAFLQIKAACSSKTPKKTYYTKQCKTQNTIIWTCIPLFHFQSLLQSLLQRQAYRYAIYNTFPIDKGIKTWGQ